MSNSAQTTADTDRKYVLHPYTNLSGRHDLGPFTIVGGEGIYVEDNRGNRLIEAMSGLWCAGLGLITTDDEIREMFDLYQLALDEVYAGISDYCG